MTKFQDGLALLARVAFSAIFVIAGYQKIIHFAGTATYLASKGLPYATLFLGIATFMEFGGGLCVLFGWQARLGAFLLLLFMIPVTFVFHSFWTYDPMVAVNQMHHFLKNIAIMGGALYIMAYGAGRYSFDKRKR